MNPLLKKVIRNEHQLQKYTQLTELASQVTDGVIVELGTYLGYGTIALCEGAQVPVYTVDDYQPKTGWAGEFYGPKDLEIANRNLREAEVVRDEKTGLGAKIVWMDINKLADKFWVLGYPSLNISLLFWDLGIPSRLCEDFEAWQPHITGKFIVHDTEDNRLGSDLLNPDPAGWSKKKDGVFWVLSKRD